MTPASEPSRLPSAPETAAGRCQHHCCHISAAAGASHLALQLRAHSSYRKPLPLRPVTAFLCRFRVLDECDEMLNMGFVEDVEKILTAGGDIQTQTLLFSATLPSWVKDITRRFLQASHKRVDLVGTDKMKVGGASLGRICPSLQRHAALWKSSLSPQACPLADEIAGRSPASSEE